MRILVFFLSLSFVRRLFCFTSGPFWLVFSACLMSILSSRFFYWLAHGGVSPSRSSAAAYVWPLVPRRPATAGAGTHPVAAARCPMNNRRHRLIMSARRALPARRSAADATSCHIVQQSPIGAGRPAETAAGDVTPPRPAWPHHTHRNPSTGLVSHSRKTAWPKLS